MKYTYTAWDDLKFTVCGLLALFAPFLLIAAVAGSLIAIVAR